VTAAICIGPGFFISRCVKRHFRIRIKPKNLLPSRNASHRVSHAKKRPLRIGRPGSIDEEWARRFPRADKLRNARVRPYRPRDCRTLPGGLGLGDRANVDGRSFRQRRENATLTAPRGMVAALYRQDAFSRLCVGAAVRRRIDAAAWAGRGSASRRHGRHNAHRNRTSHGATARTVRCYHRANACLEAHANAAAHSGRARLTTRHAITRIEHERTRWRGREQGSLIDVPRALASCSGTPSTGGRCSGKMGVSPARAAQHGRRHKLDLT
jgi:hypothetical protein